MARSSLRLVRDHGGPTVGAVVTIVFRRPDESEIVVPVALAPPQARMGVKLHPEGLHHEHVDEPTPAALATALRSLADQLDKGMG